MATNPTREQRPPSQSGALAGLLHDPARRRQTLDRLAGLALASTALTVVSTLRAPVVLALLFAGATALLLASAVALATVPAVERWRRRRARRLARR